VLPSLIGGQASADGSLDEGPRVQVRTWANLSASLVILRDSLVGSGGGVSFWAILTGSSSSSRQMDQMGWSIGRTGRQSWGLRLCGWVCVPPPRRCIVQGYYL